MMTHRSNQSQGSLDPADERAAKAPALDTAPPALDVLADGLLSTEEVAALIGVDASTLRRWRSAQPPAGPPFVSISERVTKYCRSDVRRWIDVRRVATADPAAPSGRVVGL